MRRSPIAPLALALTLLLTACGGAPPAPTAAAPPEAPSGQLTVFAAASLTDAFTDIGAAFMAANPGVRISFNFAGSQQLATQISEGAPADIFASANRTQMQVAIDSTRVVSGTQRTFARNQLVAITPRDNPANISQISDLARPGVKLILADASVPAGQYAQDVLTRASALPEYGAAYRESVLANVVSFENNVRQVLTKIVIGEGDAGIVYRTDAALEADKLQQIAIPDALNTIAAYPIAPIADSASPEVAQAFIDFVLGPEGQRILGRYGFTAAGPAT